MRIVYGVHGYSRGHATRAASVLSGLSQEHDVIVFAGRDARPALEADFTTYPVPTLSYVYGENGKISVFRTARHNIPLVRDLVSKGPGFRDVARRIHDFRPDLVISDAEPWTHQVSRHLGIPRVGFDHFGIMVHCQVPLRWTDRLRSSLDRWAYLALMGRPERQLVSSFYPAPPKKAGIALVGPLLREEVKAIRPSDGEHILAYLNNGAVQMTPRVRAAFRDLGLPVRLYGAGLDGRDGLVEMRPPSNEAFLRDLASCRAVVSTAGNQLVGEVQHYGKAILVLPEGTVEQRMNADAVVRMGIGEALDFGSLSSDVIRRFLERAPEYAANARTAARDGRQDALVLLEQWGKELSPRRRQGRLLAEVTA